MTRLIINPIFVIHKTYTVDDLKLNVIKSNQNRRKYYKFIIEKSNNGKHLISIIASFKKLMKSQILFMKFILYLKVI